MSLNCHLTVILEPQAVFVQYITCFPQKCKKQSCVLAMCMNHSRSLHMRGNYIVIRFEKSHLPRTQHQDTFITIKR